MKVKDNKRVYMKKVVINNCYGGFGLSYEGVMEYAKLKGFKLYAFTTTRNKDATISLHKYVYYNPAKDPKPFVIMYSKRPLNKDGTYSKVKGNDFSPREIDRDDPILVKVVEKLGKKANGDCAELKIVEVPSDVKWTIDEYDGMESVEEVHQSWS